MLWASVGRLEFLLVKEEPHPLHIVERGAKGLAEGASFGRRSGRLWAAGEPPHDVPGGGHKIVEDVGFPPVVVSLLDVVVVIVEGDVILNRCRGCARRGVFCERERWAGLFFYS